MKDTQSKEHIENINKYLILAPLPFSPPVQCHPASRFPTGCGISYSRVEEQRAACGKAQINP